MLGWGFGNKPFDVGVPVIVDERVRKRQHGLFEIGLGVHRNKIESPASFSCPTIGWAVDLVMLLFFLFQAFRGEMKLRPATTCHRLSSAIYRAGASVGRAHPSCGAYVSCLLPSAPPSTSIVLLVIGGATTPPCPRPRPTRVVYLTCTLSL